MRVSLLTRIMTYTFRILVGITLLAWIPEIYAVFWRGSENAAILMVILLVWTFAVAFGLYVYEEDYYYQESEEDMAVSDTPGESEHVRDWDASAEKVDGQWTFTLAYSGQNIRPFSWHGLTVKDLAELHELTGSMLEGLD